MGNTRTIKKTAEKTLEQLALEKIAADKAAAKKAADDKSVEDARLAKEKSDKEEEEKNNTISIRRHGQEGKGNITVSVDEFARIVQEEIDKTLKTFNV